MGISFTSIEDRNCGDLRRNCRVKAGRQAQLSDPEAGKEEGQSDDKVVEGMGRPDKGFGGLMALSSFLVARRAKE